MATIFDKALLDGIRKGKIPGKSKEARSWFRQKAKSIGGDSLSVMKTDERERFKNRTRAGTMYFFSYDPKHKATLPYYDRFPLIFPVGPAPGGFYGINFHYLPLPLRAKLMDALYTVVNNDRMDESTRIRLSYGMLKDAAKFKEFKPTFKHYLRSQLRSRFFEVQPSEWDISLFLPVANFEKASQREVWRDSRKIIRG